MEHSNCTEKVAKVYFELLFRCRHNYFVSNIAMI